MIPCPECGGEMEMKPLKVSSSCPGGFHFICTAMKPVRHTVTLFWKRPSEAPLPSWMSQPGRAGVAKAVPSVAPPNRDTRAAALLSRVEKLMQG